MRTSAFLQRVLRANLVLACLCGTSPRFDAQTPRDNGEIIVMIRHGEKPAAGLGQLSCKGLNRSLALPSLLIGQYGRPDYIYAPNPSVQVNDGNNQPTFSYLRPLATIEPTAIRLGMPVNTQIGYDEIVQLQQALLQPANAHSLIFVAWEHVKLHEFARQMLLSYGTGAAQLTNWPDSDYETIYVFHITRWSAANAPQVNLEIQKENLGNSLQDSCPGPQ